MALWLDLLLTFSFGKANQNQICSLNALLLFFEVVSRWKVNKSKSELVSVGNVCKKCLQSLWLAYILRCKVSSFPMKYLSLPLGASLRAKSLPGCKRLYLSKGCRMTTLIWSTLSNLPTHFLPLFPILACVNPNRETPG